MIRSIRSPTTPERLAALYARLALGSAFLSAVAARAGLWDDRPRPFAQFTHYAGEVLAFLPRFTIPFLAVASTVAETALGVLLIAGVGLPWTARASALLLAAFAISMAISFGIKSPLDASVFSASAAALLLALSPRSSGLSASAERPGTSREEPPTPGGRNS